MRRYILWVSVLFAGQVTAAPQARSDVSAVETRKLLHRYGACVVKRQEARASEAILANVDNGVLIRKYGRLIDGSCLTAHAGRTVKVRFQGDQYRYALADALIARQFAGKPAPMLESVPRLDHRDPGDPPSRLSAKGKTLSEKAYQDALRGHKLDKGNAYLSRFGECVVRNDPAAARALLLSEPTSVEEASRFDAMRTALGTCLPENETLNFGKLALRGTVALNYYRLASAIHPAERANA